jgi:hypothetical protein
LKPNLSIPGSKALRCIHMQLEWDYLFPIF